MKPTAIPVLSTPDPAVNRFAEAVKQNVDTLTGQARNTPRLQPLSATSSTAEIVARLNILLARMQGD